MPLQLAGGAAGQRRALQRGGQRRVQARQRLQRGQRRGLEVGAPAVVFGARREPALQRGAVVARAQLGVEAPAGRAAGERNAGVQRHPGHQAVAQIEAGLATQRQQAGEGRGQCSDAAAGLQVGVPAPAQAVRALPPGAGFGAGEPGRRVEAGQLATAAQLPRAIGRAAGLQRSLRAGAAAAGEQFAQVNAPGRAAAFGVGLGADLHRQRAACVEPAIKGDARLGVLGCGRCDGAIGRRQASELQRQRAAQRHRRGAGVECGRAHAVQAQREVCAGGVPFAAALDAAAAVGQLEREFLHHQTRSLAGVAAEFEFERSDRQALLVPAAGQAIGQRYAGAHRCVLARRIDIGAARQFRAWQAAAERGQVEVLGGRGQRGQRPGRERLHAGLGPQRGARRLRAAELRLHRHAGQGSACRELGLPRRCGSVVRAQLGLRLERVRCVAGQRAVGLHARAVPGEGQRADAVQGAVARAELGAGHQVGERRLRVDLQAADACALQRQRNRQAQRGRRREGAARRRATDLDALGPRLDQLEADPGAVMRPPLPARVLPGQAVHGQRALADAQVDTPGAERPATEVAGCSGEGDARHAHEQPGVGAAGGEQPGQAGDQQRAGQGECAEYHAQAAARRRTVSCCNIGGRVAARHGVRTQCRPTNAAATA